ncbi:nuclear transport factor 2 family protein [Halarcobacter ebronensis]|uniref:SnoaL-like domain-containing protein n=1 Tax=Halarcobacter ebronensis TaxID=1462615 RepID=A0A4Q1AGV8_9BACT|nr:nuclear transport factor 2 family protein [Halarcobacter ebronensis]QKF82968.1 nuclear transport factor 2 family protein [Halarcobacter ebronensis]RXK02834.1 hypothetical protein CRV07_13180 [Halarcobacter ebronensis]
MIAKNYADFFETLNENISIVEYKKYFDEGTLFKDPFHEVKGVGNIYNIFMKMYKNLDNPKFKIEEIVENDTTSYIKWIFYFSFKGEEKRESFSGVSRVYFNDKKMVISHEDFWDAAENIYEKIPLLKYFIKLVKIKIKN